MSGVVQAWLLRSDVFSLSAGREYTAAVEAKQVAQQEAQRAQFLVEKAIQEKQQKVVQAEGEAAAAKMIGEAIKENPGYLKLRKIRAAQEIAKTVSHCLTVTCFSRVTCLLDLTCISFSAVSLSCSASTLLV